MKITVSTMAVTVSSNSVVHTDPMEQHVFGLGSAVLGENDCIVIPIPIVSYKLTDLAVTA